MKQNDAIEKLLNLEKETIFMEEETGQKLVGISRL